MSYFCGMENMRNDMYASILQEERMRQLLSKPVVELCEMILRLEAENVKAKEYRKRLVQIRNLATPVEERRGKGRPKKED